MTEQEFCNLKAGMAVRPADEPDGPVFIIAAEEWYHGGLSHQAVNPGEGALIGVHTVLIYNLEGWYAGSHKLHSSDPALSDLKLGDHLVRAVEKPGITDQVYVVIRPSKDNRSIIAICCRNIENPKDWVITDPPRPTF